MEYLIVPGFRPAMSDKRFGARGSSHRTSQLLSRRTWVFSSSVLAVLLHRTSPLRTCRIDSSVEMTLRSRMPQDARELLPLKPLVFQVLLALTDGERHGWSLVREVQQRTGGDRILPANFYRTLRAMLAEGLIEEAGRTDDRRYFRTTTLGRDAARLEARRLQELLSDARTRRLLRKT